MQDTGANRLCAAIICQAVKDYKLWQKTLLQGKRPTVRAEMDGESAETFFKSDLFQELTLVNYEVDPDKLMKRLREEVERGLGEQKKKKVFGRIKEIG